MEVTALVLENIEEVIQNEISNSMPSEEELENRKIQKLIGNFEDEEDSKDILINVTKYYKEIQFFFRLNAVDAVFLSTLEWKEKPIMVILLAGKEYNCVYENTKYETIKNYLNNI